MRVTGIDWKEVAIFEDGLDDISMGRLGKEIIIAGRNGSGKSRLLERISRIAEIRMTNERANLQAHFEHFKLQLSYLEQMEENYSNDQQIKNYRSEVKNTEFKLNCFKVISFDEEKPLVIKFVPNSTELRDSRNMNHNQLMQTVSALDEELGVQNSADYTIAKIQSVQNIYYNVTHPDANFLEEEKQIAISNYSQLKQLIHDFLGTELTRTQHSEAALFGKAISDSGLSNGQKILLQLCVTLFSQSAKLNSAILLMDEPENYLHPSALIQTIDKIRENLGNGQLWIATHSVPLLAHFDTSSIWYMEDNKISYSGREPEKVLKGLLGDDEQIGKLTDFLSLPAIFASNQYAYECLTPPGVVGPNTADPQTTQIREAISGLRGEGKIRVLDLGAGKGRLASTMLDTYQAQNGSSLMDVLDYFAFDLDTKDRDDCITAIERIYSSADGRYFNTEQSLKAELDQESFDVVVMCNVLHEIPPRDWLTLFSDRGLIMSLLKPEGFLLLVEDTLIPTGEKAYENGFLVLTSLELKRLFDIREADVFISSSKYDGRLEANLIPKSCLQRITAQSRLEALREVKYNSQVKIRDLRGRTASYKNGKLHGFYVQQFANAELNISEFVN